MIFVISHKEDTIKFISPDLIPLQILYIKSNTFFKYVYQSNSIISKTELSEWNFQTPLLSSHLLSLM